jgi:hypothetical protein
MMSLVSGSATERRTRRLGAGMKTKSIRIPREMAEAIGLEEREERIEESTAMRKLIQMGFEVYVGNLYEAGKNTLRRDSHLLGRSQPEVMDLFLEAGIKGSLEASDVLTSLDRFARQGEVDMRKSRLRSTKEIA